MKWVKLDGMEVVVLGWGLEDEGFSVYGIGFVSSEDVSKFRFFNNFTYYIKC